MTALTGTERPGAEASRAGASARRWRGAFGLRSAGVVYALLLLFAGLSALTETMGRPPYLSPVNVANLLEQSAFVGIMAVGMALLLISGSFDLSVGSLAALCALLTAWLTNEVGVAGAVGLTLLAGVAGGLLNGSVHHFVGVNPFIVTLGTLTIFRGLGLMLAEGRTILIRDPQQAALLESFTAGYWTTPNLLVVGGLAGLAAAAGLAWRGAPRVLAVLAALAGAGLLLASLRWHYGLRLAMATAYWFAVAGLAWFFLAFTVRGKRLYAVGGNLRAAEMAGVRTGLYKVASFGVVGGAAGLVGVLFAGRLGAVDPNSFSGAELTVIASAVVGGVSILGGSGSVIKAVIGTLLLFTISNGFNILNINAYFQLVFAGLVTVASAALYVVTDQRRRG